jgi:hypothetical protein
VDQPARLDPADRTQRAVQRELAGDHPALVSSGQGAGSRERPDSRGGVEVGVTPGTVVAGARWNVYAPGWSWRPAVLSTQATRSPVSRAKPLRAAIATSGAGATATSIQACPARTPSTQAAGIRVMLMIWPMDGMDHAATRASAGTKVPRSFSI